MVFPIPGATFPSPEWALAFDQYNANDAWYSDDQRALQSVYSGTGEGANRGDNPATHYNKGDGTRRAGGLRGILSRMFNGKIIDATEHRTRIHAPVASNLAVLSSDLLLAEPATFRLNDKDGKALSGEAQVRLDKVMNGEDTHRTLIHAAELTAGLSATALTAHWDPAVSETPWMGVTACDAAIPEFKAGRLVAMNLYTAFPETDTVGLLQGQLVHVERHEVGAIIHGLLRITFDGKITGVVPLENHEATEHIPLIPGSRKGDIEGTIVLPTGIKTLTAGWWRNRPTKTFRKYGQLAMMGRADFEGVEQLLDAVDEVWSSWMRDIKIARARLIVPETFLDVQGAGLGGSFDDDREILTALQFTDLGPEQGKISAHQFEIRAKEHADTLLGLTREITQFAGYSLSSYGERGDGGSVTATEVTDRTTLTERTRDKKFLYFAQAVKPLTHTLMELDAAHYRGKAIPNDSTLEIEITELSQIDPEKEARMFQYLRSAMAASTDTLVRAAHPDWDDKKVKREVILIQNENGLSPDADPGTEDRVDDPNQDPNADPSKTDDDEVDA